MRLKSCFEYALACGLTTVGEAYSNIRIHAPQIARFEDIKDMIDALTRDIEYYELTPDMLVVDVIDKMGWEIYYKNNQDEAYGCPSIRTKEE
jgi:hypothetical protein